MAHCNLVGIDLGTTYSAIAHLDSTGLPTVIPNSQGRPLTPSVVFRDGGTVLVGDFAKQAAGKDATRAAMFFKREMGEKFYARPVADEQIRPETLSGIVLRKLKQDAEKRIGPISKAVITVPAYFDNTRRRATQDAGRIAGLDVLDIINEPTAAALSYAFEHRHGNHIGEIDFPGGHMTAMVYDLGGGTFDVSIVRLASQHFETLATGGAVELGGKDWDDRIVDHISAEFLRRFRVDPKEDPKRLSMLQGVAEEAKQILSDLTTSPIQFAYRGNELELAFTRDDFERISCDLLEHTQLVTRMVLDQAELRDWNMIDRVLLVGGSTRMPMIKQMLRELTGREPDDTPDPDQIVARGAAIHAGIVAVQRHTSHIPLGEKMRRELGAIEEINVNAHSLGVVARSRKTNERINATLIRKNTQLPAAASRIFQLKEAGARQIKVTVLEGEAREAAANIVIGECRVTDLPPSLPRGAPVQVRCSYGNDGLISVMALDMTSGKLAHTQMKRENGMSEEEIQHEIRFVNNLTIK